MIARPDDLSETLILATLPGPLGPMLLVTDERGVVRALDFADCEARMQRLIRLHYGLVALTEGSAPEAVRIALARYFAGEADALRAVSWATGGTDFQRAVWRGLTDIPVGQTDSYAGLATRIGRPTAVRAVGLANGSNPVGIIVPCHRVIGKSGALTGYAGGIERKRWLLEHERRWAELSAAA